MYEHRLPNVTGIILREEPWSSTTGSRRRNSGLEAQYRRVSSGGIWKVYGYVRLIYHPRLVENPMVLSFKQVVEEFEQITAPISLVCAGNRRKEQNQVRKSKGFSWGAAGVSTALWTGPVMSEVLRRAKPLRKAKYVCMEGADKLVWKPLFFRPGIGH